MEYWLLLARKGFSAVLPGGQDYSTASVAEDELLLGRVLLSVLHLKGRLVKGCFVVGLSVRGVVQKQASIHELLRLEVRPSSSVRWL